MKYPYSHFTINLSEVVVSYFIIIFRYVCFLF